jgi:hypothetical protein
MNFRCAGTRVFGLERFTWAQHLSALFAREGPVDSHMLPPHVAMRVETDRPDVVAGARQQLGQCLRIRLFQRLHLLARGQARQQVEQARLGLGEDGLVHIRFQDR